MPDDFYYEWTDKVRAIWREVISEADPLAGTTKGEAREIASERIRALVDSGDLKIPVDTAINAAIEKADSEDGKATDRVLRAIVTGAAALDLDGDPILDFVVKLGAGKRKPWRNVNRDDLVEIEQARYRNLRNAQNSYDAFRTDYEPAFAALSRYETCAAAVAAGVFGAPESDAA